MAKKLSGSVTSKPALTDHNSEWGGCKAPVVMKYGLVSHWYFKCEVRSSIVLKRFIPAGRCGWETAYSIGVKQNTENFNFLEVSWALELKSIRSRGSKGLALLVREWFINPIH